MPLLTREQIQERIRERQNAPRYKHVRPLSQYAEDLISSLQLEGGIGFGLLEIDALTRGFRPTDLVIISGFAHSAKTQLLLTLIVNNPSKRVLFVSLDDPAVMLIAKLVAMKSGIAAERIESRVREGDEGIKRKIREIASVDFPNLIIIDETIGIPSILNAVDEATEMWGQPPDLVALDYVEMLPGANIEDQSAQVKQKMNALKAWAKHATYPIVAIHQGTRSNARPGEPITLLSLGFSGEQQASLVIGCRRKRDKPDLDPYERGKHDSTLTLHVCKNKHAGGKLSKYEGIDYYLDSDTGLIRERTSSAQVAQQQRVREWDDL